MTPNLSGHDRALLDFIRSVRRSTYTLTSGMASDMFIDLDNYILGGVGDEFSDPDLVKTRREVIIKEVIPAITKAARDHSVARIVFVEKPNVGPVGMLLLMGLVMEHSDLEASIVRPHKRALAASLKGRPIIDGERVLLITDVTTRGTTVSRAARRLRELGAIVPAAYTVIDRSGEAKAALAAEGLALEVSFSLKEGEELSSRIAAANT